MQTHSLFSHFTNAISVLDLSEELAQTVENLPTVWETLIQSLSQKDPLKKGMAVHSSILAWRILWKEEPGSVQSMKYQRVGQDRAANTFTFTIYLSEIQLQPRSPDSKYHLGCTAMYSRFRGGSYDSQDG